MQNHSSAVFQHVNTASSQQVQVQGGPLALAMVQFPEQEQLRCPRCDSSNTKFCYYNNYNLLQPRHFCKACRRYWTKGGALRNIPVGGGSRKNGGSSSSAGAATKRSSNEGKEASPTSSKRANIDRNPSDKDSPRIDLDGDSIRKKVRGGVVEDLNAKHDDEYLRNGEWSGWPDLSIGTPAPDNL